mmetsp:Transcript_19259/g.39640  ORF Transcript_19259/g.39640 Transcript_19259/m.39640 type:complete len:238 (-) Transcript_19259:105-818(-)
MAIRRRKGRAKGGMYSVPTAEPVWTDAAQQSGGSQHQSPHRVVWVGQRRSVPAARRSGAVPSPVRPLRRSVQRHPQPHSRQRPVPRENGRLPRDDWVPVRVEQDVRVPRHQPPDQSVRKRGSVFQRGRVPAELLSARAAGEGEPDLGGGGESEAGPRRAGEQCPVRRHQRVPPREASVRADAPAEALRLKLHHFPARETQRPGALPPHPRHERVRVQARGRKEPTGTVKEGADAGGR